MEPSQSIKTKGTTRKRSSYRDVVGRNYNRFVRDDEPALYRLGRRASDANQAKGQALWRRRTGASILKHTRDYRFSRNATKLNIKAKSRMGRSGHRSDEKSDSNQNIHRGGHNSEKFSGGQPMNEGKRGMRQSNRPPREQLKINGMKA